MEFSAFEQEARLGDVQVYATETVRVARDLTDPGQSENGSNINKEPLREK